MPSLSLRHFILLCATLSSFPLASLPPPLSLSLHLCRCVRACVCVCLCACLQVPFCIFGCLFSGDFILCFFLRLSCLLSSADTYEFIYRAPLFFLPSLPPPRPPSLLYMYFFSECTLVYAHVCVSFSSLCTALAAPAFVHVGTLQGKISVRNASLTSPA